MKAAARLHNGDTASARLDVAQGSTGAQDSTSRAPRDGSPPVRPRLLGVREAAAYLSLSHWTVREMAWRGEVPEVRLGRRLLFDLRDLDALIETSKQRRGTI